MAPRRRDCGMSGREDGLGAPYHWGALIERAAGVPRGIMRADTRVEGLKFSTPTGLEFGVARTSATS